MNRGRGFTLVELIVVIAVIAILATLATLGVARYLADGRDTQRSANATTISEALEKYYDQKGEYPSCGAITATGSSVSSDLLKGIDQSALLVPGADSSTNNSIRCNATLAMSGADFFQYIGDGSADCTGSGSCLNYTLRYRSEADNQIKEIKSRREANIATSGVIRDLSVSNLSYKTLSLGWSPVQNILSYTIEQSSSSTFATIQNTFTSTSPNYSITNLAQGQQYYFRVMPIGGTQQGSWSNIADATALVLGTPQNLQSGTPTATTVPLQWEAADNADANTRYYVEQSTNNFSTFTTLPAVNGLSTTASGLSTGTTYSFRVRAGTSTLSPIYYSQPSNVVTTAVKPNAPTGVTATTNSATQITVSWAAVSGATSYTVRYGTSSGAITTAITGATGTSRAVTGLLQGQPYFFQVYAVQNGTESNPSATATATTTINAPGAYNLSAWVDQGQSLYSTSPVTCPTGTTANFYWNANGGFWVSGTQHRTTGYWLNWGQSVTVQVATRCEKGGVVSGWTWSSNTASLSRPGMNFSMWTGSDMCAGGFCGRQLFSSWNNVCGTGAPRIYARQLSAYANWIADSPSNDQLLFKGGSSPGVWVDYYDVNIGCTAASGSVRVISAYRCTGCS